MRPDVSRDLTDSAAAFKETVWPKIGLRFFGTGELISVETDTGILARKWDALAGIDAWQVRDNIGMRGIASRVQRANGRPFDTFTVRKSRDSGVLTEYDKRRRAIDNQDGWLYPEFAVHAYVKAARGEPMRGKPLLSAAAARTRDIIYCIDRGFTYEQRVAGAAFYCVAWDVIEREREVRVWRPGDGS